MIMDLLRIVSVVEIAVDVRGAEVPTFLISMGGESHEIRDFATQMLRHFRGTAWLVAKVVKAALQRHHTSVKDEEQQKIYRQIYENAKPS